MKNVRRLVVLVATIAALTTAVTGLALPASRPHPVVDGWATTLTDGVAGAGFAKRFHTAIPAEMIGFSWKGGAGQVDYRVKRGSTWSAWQSVDGDPAEGPDQSSKENHHVVSAGPVWLGAPVRDVEARVVSGSLRGVRAEAIRTEVTTPPGIRPAGALPQRPGIIGRAGWGADESWRTYASGCSGSPDYAPNVRYAVLHHTDTTNSYTPDQSASIIRGIYYFHTHTNGWCDIGYNFLVDRFGQVFEGRYGGVSNAVVGAHAGGFNYGSTGVAIIGEFQDTSVTPAAYNATRDLLAWKLASHKVNANTKITVTAAAFDGSNYPAGTQVSVWTISGHRDLDQTSCPGDFAYNLLGQLRVDVQSLIASYPSFPAVSRSGTWYLRQADNSGPATIAFGYGNTGDVALMCDWDGDGVRTPGVYRNGWFYLRNSNTSGPADVSFPYGNVGDKPICGDWNGDGVDTVGVVRNSGSLLGGSNTWYLRNSNSGGKADLSFGYGNTGDKPVVGDWNGDRTDTPGVVRNNTWYLRNSNTAGTADASFGYGNTGDLPVVGDWNADGVDTPGIVRGDIWYLRNSNTPGNADLAFAYGDTSDVFLSW